MKPYKLRRWRWSDGGASHYFFTCARPGRVGREESKTASVPDRVVREWLLSLPGPRTALVSLLGRKPDGRSEFAFYSFYGGYDVTPKRQDQLSFREWVVRNTAEAIEVREHPTNDFERVPEGVLVGAMDSIVCLASSGHTVVLFDSGGEQRTGQVCRFMKAVEDSSSF